jgi:hypothetical protein
MGAQTPWVTPVWTCKHDSHSPLHRALQQTPSVQKPEMHAVSFEQDRPLTSGPHWPLGFPVLACEQASGAAQALPQQKPSTQKPEPQVDPDEHVAPFAMGPQVPSGLPVKLWTQALLAAEQEVSQQMLAAQLRDEHWPASEQDWPFTPREKTSAVLSEVPTTTPPTTSTRPSCSRLAVCVFLLPARLPALNQPLLPFFCSVCASPLLPAFLPPITSASPFNSVVAVWAMRLVPIDGPELHALVEELYVSVLARAPEEASCPPVTSTCPAPDGTLAVCLERALPIDGPALHVLFVGL